MHLLSLDLLIKLQIFLDLLLSDEMRNIFWRLALCWWEDAECQTWTRGHRTDSTHQGSLGLANTDWWREISAVSSHRTPMLTSIQDIIDKECHCNILCLVLKLPIPVSGHKTHVQRLKISTGGAGPGENRHSTVDVTIIQALSSARIQA